MSNLDDGEGDRTMNKLSDQIKAAHVQRMRELGDLIVNKLPFLPEEMDKLRQLIHDMSSDTSMQRTTCFGKFAELERMLDKKVSEVAESNRTEMQALKVEVVREITTVVVEMQTFRDIVTKFDAKQDKKFKWIYIAIFVSLCTGILGIVEGTTWFQPILKFLLGILKFII